MALDPDPTFTVDEVRETVGPLGETESVRFTFPEKPMTLATVIVIVPEFPETRLREPMFGDRKIRSHHRHNYSSAALDCRVTPSYRYAIEPRWCGSRDCNIEG